MVEKSGRLDYVIGFMKASPLPAAVLAAAALLTSGIHPCKADAIVRKSGQTLEGQVVGTSGGNVSVKVGAGVTTIPLTDVTRLIMEPPAEFTAAAAQLSSGNAKAAAAALEKINQTFSGLPAPWAERAAVMLGDAKLAAGDQAGAKAAYEQFSKTYPAAQALANLGLARLAVESGDNAAATKLLEPLVAGSDKIVLPPSGKGPELSIAFYLLGRTQEASGNKAKALENYLKASALFPFDENAVADAKKRADALRSAEPGLIAP